MPPIRKTAAAPSRLKAVDRKAAIVRAARQLFMTQGYDATRMEDIAVAADCSTGPLYHVFSSKKEVFEAVLLASIESVQGMIRNRYDQHSEASPLNRVLMACDLFLEIVAVPDTIMMTREAPRVLGEERGRELRDGRMLRTFEAGLREAMMNGEMEPEPPAPLAVILGSMIIEGVHQASLDGDQLDAYRRAVRRFVLRLKVRVPSE